MIKKLISVFWIAGLLVLFVPIMIAMVWKPFNQTASAFIIFISFTLILCGILLNVIKNKDKFDKSQMITRIVLISGVFGYNVYNLIRHLI